MSITVTLGFLLLVFVFASIVEAVAESLMKLIPDGDVWTKLKAAKVPELLALVVGIAMAIMFKIAMLTTLISILGANLPDELKAMIVYPPPIADYVITGLFMSRGSNWVHDFMKGLIDRMTPSTS